jgi:hypothetical protein
MLHVCAFELIDTENVGAGKMHGRDKASRGGDADWAQILLPLAGMKKSGAAQIQGKLAALRGRHAEGASEAA